MKTDNNNNKTKVITNERGGGTEEDISSSKKECTSCEQKNNDDDAPCVLLHDMTVSDVPSTISTCANCGKEGSDINNTCNKCKQVKYCNAACKKKHRHKHKKDCEEYLRLAAERAAKLHDEQLFKQPPPPREDCPICFLRLPSKISGSTYMTCCGKVICCGCIYAVKTRTKKHSLCAFCRTPDPTSTKEEKERYEKRIELNDPIAMYILGAHYDDGSLGLPQNHAKALELWHKAGKLGYAPAYNNIGACYHNGEGVEMDTKKAIHYYELAAMAGNEVARNNLGAIVEWVGNTNRAIKHYMIAVGGGYSNSVAKIQSLYSDGHATKEEYAQALQAYQTYLSEIRSVQRDEYATASGDPYY